MLITFILHLRFPRTCLLEALGPLVLLWKPGKISLQISKNSKQWAKGKPRGSMRWERDGPCLTLQWSNNEVVSLLTTIESANYQTSATRETKTAWVWDSV